MKRALVVVSLSCASGLVGCGGNEPPPRDVSNAELTSAHARLSMPAPEVLFPDQLTVQAPPTGASTLAQWGLRYPDAARQLAAWLEDHGEISARLVTWEAHHPENLSVLVSWAITHPYENVGAFLFDRAGWDEFARFSLPNREVIDSFLGWIRRSRLAAEELVMHPAPLAGLASERAGKK